MCLHRPSPGGRAGLHRRHERRRVFDETPATLPTTATAADRSASPSSRSERQGRRTAHGRVRVLTPPRAPTTTTRCCSSTTCATGGARAAARRGALRCTPAARHLPIGKFVFASHRQHSPTPRTWSARRGTAATRLMAVYKRARRRPSPTTGSMCWTWLEARPPRGESSARPESGRILSLLPRGLHPLSRPVCTATSRAVSTVWSRWTTAALTRPRPARVDSGGARCRPAGRCCTAGRVRCRTLFAVRGPAR